MAVALGVFPNRLALLTEVVHEDSAGMQPRQHTTGMSGIALVSRCRRARRGRTVALDCFAPLRRFVIAAHITHVT
jgi:hypothetical protein